MSQRLAGAVCWEEKAQELFATKAPMSEFDDILRLYYKCYFELLAVELM